MKRFFDIIASGCGLLVLSPIFLIMAIQVIIWMLSSQTVRT